MTAVQDLRHRIDGLWNAPPDDEQDRVTAGPVDGAAVLGAVYAFLGRFVAYPSESAQIAHALWIVHTHLMDAWESTPRIAFLSPEPASGKTRAIEISELLVPSPVEAVNVSPSYLFRKVGGDAGLPTILYDEIDTVFGPKAKENEEIRGLLNAGHRRGAVAGRVVMRGKEGVCVDFPAYCAVALAGLGDLPDTILSRSVVVRMRRRRSGERVEPYRRRVHTKAGHDLRDRLAAWAATIIEQVSTAYPEMPAGVEDRDADTWEPLLAVADAAGDDWPKRARVAAVALIADSRESTPSLGVRLLEDIRTAFSDADQMSTDLLLSTLSAQPESPWGDLKGKPLDARRLAGMLRKYAVRSRTIRAGDATPKGYTREDLTDAWSRYLSSPSDESATSATSATAEPGTTQAPHEFNESGDGASKDGGATHPQHVAAQAQHRNSSATEEPRNTGHVADVADVADLRESGRAPSVNGQAPDGRTCEHCGAPTTSPDMYYCPTHGGYMPSEGEI